MKKIIKLFTSVLLITAMMATPTLAANNTEDLELNPEGTTIEINTATITENAGCVDTLEDGGKIVTNDAGATVNVVNSESEVKTNNGLVGGLYGGTVDTNNGTIVNVSNTFNSMTNEPIGSTVENNTESGVIHHVAGPSTVVNNEGTIYNNEGTISNNSGTVKINDGGTVNGGVVEINLSEESTVSEATTVVQQMWQVISDKIGHLAYYGENNTEGKEDVYVQERSSEQVKVYLWEDGSMIISASDCSKKLSSITIPNGGATIEALADGSYRISGITKDINLAVLFEGDSKPKPIEIKTETPSETDENKPQEQVAVTTPAQITLSTDMPTIVPTAPSAIVNALAPVVAANALYASVDLNGTPVAVNIVADKTFTIAKAEENILSLALQNSGIKISNMQTAFSGTITTAVANSVMTLRISAIENMTTYVVFTDPVTGKTTYVRPKINADGTISFEVPFANARFAVIAVK